jgi:hypothetical protein
LQICEEEWGRRDRHSAGTSRAHREYYAYGDSNMALRVESWEFIPFPG